MPALGLGVGLGYGGAALAFDFSVASGYAVHHAARLETAGYADTDPVGTISDFAGVAQNATAAGAARATYRTNVQNGRPVFRFDGTDDVHAYAASVLNPRLTSITVYAVCKVPVGATGNHSLLGVDETNEIYFMAVRADASGQAQIFLRDSGAVQSAAAGGTTDLRDGAFHLLTFLWNLSTKTATVRVDGTQEATQTNASVNVATIPPGAPALGMGYRAGLTRPSMAFKNDIAELVGYEALHTGADLTNTEAALKSLWGTP